MYQCVKKLRNYHQKISNNLEYADIDHDENRVETHQRGHHISLVQYYQLQMQTMTQDKQTTDNSPYYLTIQSANYVQAVHTSHLFHGCQVLYEVLP